MPNSEQHSADTITAADNVLLAVGDPAFDYYNMKAGRFEDLPDAQGWAHFRHDDGGRDLLNGERVCSLAHARRMGWL